MHLDAAVIESVWDYPRPPRVESVAERRVEDVAWSYERPTAAFEALTSYLAFYPGRVDQAWVGDERVRAQAGGFYGGWITRLVTGPFKGEPGTIGW